MKKVVFGIFLLFAVSALAQELPRVETYLGYTFVRVNSAINVPAFSANGGMGEIAFNFSKWFAGVGSFPAVHNGNISGLHVDQTLFGYMFGPRLHFRLGRLTPFGEALFGGTHDTRSFRNPVPVTIVGGVNTVNVFQRFVNSSDAFSMQVGGGLDLPISDHLAFRPIKLDYYLTRFQPVFIPNLGSINRNRNQNNLLYSTGFNFRF